MAHGSVDDGYVADGYRFRVWPARTFTAVSSHAWAWEAELWIDYSRVWSDRGTAPNSEQARLSARNAIGGEQESRAAAARRDATEWETVQ